MSNRAATKNVWEDIDLSRKYLAYQFITKPDIGATLEWLSKHEECTTLIDFGCADLHFALRALHESSNNISNIIGYDPNEEMLGKASFFIREGKIQASAAVTPDWNDIKPNTADIITSHRVINVLDKNEVSEHFQHVSEKLKHKGHYLCSIFNWNDRPRKVRAKRINALDNGKKKRDGSKLRTGMQWHTKPREGSSDYAKFNTHIVNTHYSEKFLKQQATKAGFKLVSSDNLHVPNKYNTPIIHLDFELQ